MHSTLSLDPTHLRQVDDISLYLEPRQDLFEHHVQIYLNLPQDNTGVQSAPTNPLKYISGALYKIIYKLCIINCLIVLTYEDYIQ